MDYMTESQLARAELCVIEKGKPARDVLASSKCSINNYYDIIFVIYLGEGKKNSSSAQDARHNRSVGDSKDMLSLRISKTNVIKAAKTNTSANKSLRVGMTREFRAALLCEERG